MNLRHNPQLLCEFAQIVTSHNRKLQGAQVDPEAPGAQTMNCNFAFRWLKLLGDYLIGGRFKIHIDMNSSEGWSCAPVKMHWAICILSPPRPALSPWPCSTQWVPTQPTGPPFPKTLQYQFFTPASKTPIIALFANVLSPEVWDPKTFVSFL